MAFIGETYYNFNDVLYYIEVDLLFYSYKNCPEVYKYHSENHTATLSSHEDYAAGLKTLAGVARVVHKYKFKDYKIYKIVPTEHSHDVVDATDELRQYLFKEKVKLI